MKLLVSVRSVAEAAIAAGGGADFVDLKEPGDGALGGLPIATIRAVVAALRASNPGLPISATIGDLPMRDLAGIAARVDAVGGCGVDYVKVGIERDPQAGAVIDALATSAWPVVPVFIADRGLDFAEVARACEARRFPGVMVDTADKRVGSLFDALPMAQLQRFIDSVRASGAMAGAAGALRLAHVPLLQALAPDFAGFRSAVCVADRASSIDPARLRGLVAALRASPVDALR